jgi:hypothetical protein
MDRDEAEGSETSKASEDLYANVDLFFGAPLPDGTVHVVGIFGPQLSTRAAGEVYMRIGSVHLSKCRGVPPLWRRAVASNLLDCDGSLVMSGAMPSEPTDPEDVGVSLYAPNPNGTDPVAS